MEKANVYERARGIERELVPLLRAIRERLGLHRVADGDASRQEAR